MRLRILVLLYGIGEPLSRLIGGCPEAVNGLFLRANGLIVERCASIKPEQSGADSQEFTPLVPRQDRCSH